MHADPDGGGAGPRTHCNRRLQSRTCYSSYSGVTHVTAARTCPFEGVCVTALQSITVLQRYSGYSDYSGPARAQGMCAGLDRPAGPRAAAPAGPPSQIVSPRDITEKSYDVMRAYDELYDLHEFMRENT